MKKLLLFSILFFLMLFQNSYAKNWNITKSIDTPESVYYDAESKSLYVSNIAGDGVKKDGKGWISNLSVDGKMISDKWIKGLNAPKGMRSYKGTLWVTDIDEVVVINIKHKKIVNKFPVKGAIFLNDIAIDPNGIVYVSDTLTSKIHKIANGKVSIFMEGNKLESPNGLLWKNGKLIVAAWGLTTDWNTKVLGRLYSVNPKTKQIEYITKTPLGNLDGLEIDKNGDFLVSDWVAGKVFRIDKNGNSKVILVSKKGSADISYVPEHNLLIVPLMKDSKIIAKGL